MRRSARQVVRNQRGFSLVELLVAVVIFALLVATIDRVFAAVNRSSRTAELAADVTQNGRVAIERLTREIRFSSSSEVRPSTLSASASTWVAYKSARLSNSAVFCVDVSNTTDALYNSPTPAAMAPCFASLPTGTYQPVWQNWIVYCFVSGVLRRDEQSTTDPSQATCEADGDAIATAHPTSSFSVTLTGTILTVTLDLRATELVQGSNVPTQRITLTGQTFIRNQAGRPR